MITKRQLSEELDKCIKQDGYAIYIKADSAVMIKEWIKDECEETMSRKNLIKMASKLKEECLKRLDCEDCPFAFQERRNAYYVSESCAIDTEPGQWELDEVEILEALTNDD